MGEEATIRIEGPFAPGSELEADLRSALAKYDYVDTSSGYHFASGIRDIQFTKKPLTI